MSPQENRPRTKARNNITACAECEKVNLESISEGKACAWKDSKCQLVDKAEVPSESVCETEAEAASKAKVHDDDDDDDEEASFTPAFLTIAVIVGILFAVRKYAENAGVEIPGLSNPTPRNGSGRSLRNHETYVQPYLSFCCLSITVSHTKPLYTL